MKKMFFCLFSAIAPTMFIHANQTPKMSKEEYRELMATIELLKYCNSYAAPLNMPRKPWSYPETLYTRIKRGERLEGIPVKEFRVMCEVAGDKLLELTQKWLQK